MWATVQDVRDLTGATVDEATRKLAASTIELKTGLIEDVPRPDMIDRDLYWLKQAVCFQAAWVAAQPDLLERSAVSSVSQDGQSATGGNADWLQLSPFARTALKRLTWRGPRGLNVAARMGQGAYMVIDGQRVWVPAGGVGMGVDTAGATSEAYDDYQQWGPL